MLMTLIFHCGKGLFYECIKPPGASNNRLVRDVMVTIRGDMSSLVLIDNKKKDILILGKDLTDALDAALTAEKNFF